MKYSFSIHLFFLRTRMLLLWKSLIRSFLLQVIHQSKLKKRKVIKEKKNIFWNLNVNFVTKDSGGKISLWIIFVKFVKTFHEILHAQGVTRNLSVNSIFKNIIGYSVYPNDLTVHFALHIFFIQMSCWITSHKSISRKITVESWPK